MRQACADNDHALRAAGALYALYLDLNERKHVMHRILTPETGWRKHSGGVWTWTFEQRQLQRAVEAPSGSAVQIAAVLGFPYIRLRAALPEELFPGSVAQSLGRKTGMSVSGLAETREENLAVMTQLRRGLACLTCSRAQIPEFDFSADAEAHAQPAHLVDKGAAHDRVPPLHPSRSRRSTTQPPPVLQPPRAQLLLSSAAMTPQQLTPSSSAGSSLLGSRRRVRRRRADLRTEELVGTALVFAYLTVQKTLPVTELTKRVTAARHFFRDVRVPGIDQSFDELHSKFLVMVGSEAGTLTERKRWMPAARLWRLMLLQRAEGCWDITESLAFALEAHEGRRPVSKQRRKTGGFLSLFLGDGDLDDNLDDAADDIMQEANDETQQADEEHPKATAVKDCPISFSSAAIWQRMPAVLRQANAQYDTQQAARAREEEERSRQERKRTARRTQIDEELSSASDTALRDSTLALSSASVETSVPTERPGLDASPQQDLLTTLLQAVSSTFPQHAFTGIMPVPACIPATSQRDMSSALVRTRQPVRTQKLAVPELEEELLTRVPVERMWATLLALHTLEHMDCCWLVDDEAEPARTIVDAGREWLEAQAAADPRIAALLAGIELHAAVERAAKDWKLIMEHQIDELRGTEVLSRFTALTHLQRASSRVIKSVMTDHSTFATFLDADGYIMRWQRFMILLTAVLSTLVTSIWYVSCVYSLRLPLAIPLRG